MTQPDPVVGRGRSPQLGSWGNPVRRRSGLAGILDRALSALERLILFTGSVGAGRAAGLLSFWLLWQKVTDHHYRASPVSPGSLLKCAVERYRGKVVSLSDGTVVAPGDQIVEIHVDNAALTERLIAAGQGQRATAWAWTVYNWALQDLRALTEPGRLPPEAKAVHGVTILGPATRRMGFDVRPLPRTRRNDLTAFFMRGLLAIYHPEGQRHLALRRLVEYPSEVWAGREALTARLWPDAAATAGPLGTAHGEE